MAGRPGGLGVVGVAEQPQVAVGDGPDARGRRPGLDVTSGRGALPAESESWVLTVSWLWPVRGTRLPEPFLPNNGALAAPQSRRVLSRAKAAASLVVRRPAATSSAPVRTSPTMATASQAAGSVPSKSAGALASPDDLFEQGGGGLVGGGVAGLRLPARAERSRKG